MPFGFLVYWALVGNIVFFSAIAQNLKLILVFSYWNTSIGLILWYTFSFCFVIILGDIIKLKSWSNEQQNITFTSDNAAILSSLVIYYVWFWSQSYHAI